MEHGRLTVVRSKAISREVNGLCRRVRPIAVDARRRVRRTSRDAALARPRSDEAALRAVLGRRPAVGDRLRLVGRAPAGRRPRVAGRRWAATSASCTPPRPRSARCRRARWCSTSRAEVGSRCAGCGRGRASRTSPPTSPRPCSTAPWRPRARVGVAEQVRAAAGRRGGPAARGRFGGPGRHVHRPALLPRPAAGGRRDGARAPARRRGHRQHAGHRHRGEVRAAAPGRPPGAPARADVLARRRW